MMQMVPKCVLLENLYWKKNPAEDIKIQIYQNKEHKVKIFDNGSPIIYNKNGLENSNLMDLFISKSYTIGLIH